MIKRILTNDVKQNILGPTTVQQLSSGGFSEQREKGVVRGAVGGATRGANGHPKGQGAIKRQSKRHKGSQKGNQRGRRGRQRGSRAVEGNGVVKEASKETKG